MKLGIVKEAIRSKEMIKDEIDKVMQELLPVIPVCFLPNSNERNLISPVCCLMASLLRPDIQNILISRPALSLLL